MSKKAFLEVSACIYRYIFKQIFFLFDPERVHNTMVAAGEVMSKSNLIIGVTSSIFSVKNSVLEQKVLGMKFENPIGLSAGYDYESRLTQILPAVGFGFETVGTITYQPYEGNPKPMLGRLPKSKSLMVNKGFKNLGAKQVVEKLSGLDFKFPLGISIGRSNNHSCNTQTKSINDILKSFSLFERSLVKHSYYELNISCPNLFGDVTFYPPRNLRELLKEIDKLRIKRPVFIKMPIDKSDKEVRQMLDAISDYSPRGVIFGNLQKDRTDETFDKEELAKFPIGNFSGKPTYRRSNELIKLAYKSYRKRFIIIGCGGVFNGQDAYEKISLGATLVQLITGMIFQGPQLISQINLELVDLLKRDGFTHINQAIGRRSN